MHMHIKLINSFGNWLIEQKCLCRNYWCCEYFYPGHMHWHSFCCILAGCYTSCSFNSWLVNTRRMFVLAYIIRISVLAALYDDNTAIDPFAPVKRIMCALVLVRPG